MPIAKPRLHHCKMQKIKKISLPFANTQTHMRLNIMQDEYTSADIYRCHASASSCKQASEDSHNTM